MYRELYTCTTLLLLHFWLLWVVNSVVPDAYMDEPFHVPQTQQYCKGSFLDWDPKITTFPGLYLLGVMWGHAGYQVQRLLPSVMLSALGLKRGALVLCSTGCLRGMNVVLAAACVWVIWALLQEVQAWRFDCPALSAAEGGPAQPDAAAADQQVTASAVSAGAGDSQTGSRIRQLDQHTLNTSGAGASPALANVSERPGIATSLADRQLFALVLAAYPVHWFFSFLYYTDVGALLFLLLCQLLCLRQHKYAAAAAGAVAVLFRQTNAVWVAFILGAAVLRMCRSAEVAAAAASSAAGTACMAAGGDPTAPGIARRHLIMQAYAQTAGSASARTSGNHAANSSASNYTVSGRYCAELPSLQDELMATLKVVWQRRQLLTEHLWPLATVPAAFAAFLVINGGVTVGDQAAHKPVAHLPQLLYFAAFAAAMSAPIHFTPSHVRRIGCAAWQQIRSKPFAVLTAAVAAGAASIAAVQQYSFVHPYLVADNRHYPFYVHRKILSRHPYVKFALLPIYGYCWVSLVYRCRMWQSRLWMLGFLACLAATLVPAWLLEFRYFTPGFFLLMIHSPPPGRLQLWAMATIFAAINAMTMYLFLAKPFKWADGSTARFMW